MPASSPGPDPAPRSRNPAQVFDASIEQVGCSRRRRAPAPRACRSISSGSTSRHHHQTPLRHAPAIRLLRRRLPALERCIRPSRPRPLLRQLAETPDGVRYVCHRLRTFPNGGSFRAPVRRYAIGLGCEIAMPRASSMPTISISGTTRPISRSGSPAGSASANPARSARFRRSTARSASIRTSAGFCLTGSPERMKSPPGAWPSGLVPRRPRGLRKQTQKW